MLFYKDLNHGCVWINILSQGKIKTLRQKQEELQQTEEEGQYSW